MAKASTIYKKGQKKTGGRKKGTKNKSTVTRDMLAQKLFDALDMFDIMDIIEKSILKNPADVLRVYKDTIPNQIVATLNNVGFTYKGNISPDIKKGTANGGNGG